MSDPADARLQRLLGGEHLAPLRKRLRRRFERAPLDHAIEHIHVDGLAAEEHAALAALLGRRQRHTSSLKIDLGLVDGALRRSGIAASLRDGYSTSGTRGNGLGAMRRMASTFDLYSAPGLGTAVLARVVSPSAATSSLPGVNGHRLVISAVSLPKAGETLNGDAWVEQGTERGMRILVVDGLGHGPLANEAAHAAVQAFRSAPTEDPAAAVETCHLAMRSTRGAALAVAEISIHPGVVRFAGVGNVAGSIWNGSVSHHTVSMNGTAGHGTIRPREFSYPWPAGGLLVMASDGLTTRWSLESYPGLASHDPALVAGILYRDHSRGRDDVTVVVAREAKR